MRISDWSADVCSSDLASCELWGLLKRSDEKFVTERAYENPKFVEDLVRDVAEHLQGLAGVSSFRVTAENFESIHNHSARSEEHTSELQSLMRISYAAFCLNKKNTQIDHITNPP